MSLLHETTLKLDISFYEHYSPSAYDAYGLKPFCIQEAFATPEEIAGIKGTSKTGLARKVFHLGQRLKPYYRRAILSQRHGRAFDPNILKSSEDVSLAGYWQTEKYFSDIRDIICREFTVGCELGGQSSTIAEKVATSESVSIHVRRGDRLSNPRSMETFGVCSPDYYNACVSIIANGLRDPHFFIFSDDPDWVTKELRLDYPTTYVTHNDATRNYEDLRLMSMCKHNIIANSTFSWWGAWLNPSPNKVVLCPRQWAKLEHIDTQDLLPDSWIKV